MKDRKIVYLLQSVVMHGGIQKVTIDKANYIAQYWKWQVYIVSNISDSTQCIYQSDSSIKFIKLFNNENLNIPQLKLAEKYRNLIKEINPDLVVISLDLLQHILFRLFTPKQIPIVKENHVSYNAVMENFKGKRGKLNKVISFFYKKSLMSYDKVVVLTKRDRELWGIKNCVTINNFIPSKFVNTQNNTIKYQSFAVSAGRLNKLKGFDELIQIWKQVVENNPNLTLRIYGEGNDRNNLELLINKLELSSKVFLMGATNEMSEKYQESKVVLLASQSEGFSLILAEANACGIPCIAYDCPNGPGEIIEDGKNGFLIPMGNRDLFAKRVTQLSENEILYQSMSENSLEQSKRFNVDFIMEKWRNLFEKYCNCK